MLYIGLIASYKGELKWLQGEHPLSTTTTTSIKEEGPLKSGGESKGDDDDVPAATTSTHTQGGVEANEDTVLELHSLQLSFDVNDNTPTAHNTTNNKSDSKVNNSTTTTLIKDHNQQGQGQGLDRYSHSSSRYSRAYVMKHDLTFLRAGFEELQRCRQVSLCYCYLLLFSVHLTLIVNYTVYAHYLLKFSLSPPLSSLTPLLSPEMVIILTTSLASERILRLRILLLRR